MHYYTLFNVDIDFYVVVDQHITQLYEGTLNECLWFLHSKNPEAVLFTDKVIRRKVLAGILATTEVEKKGRVGGLGPSGWVIFVKIEGKYYVQDQQFTNVNKASAYFIESLTDELRMIP